MSQLPLATELAKERNRAAEERTLMAWIRTALTLISFGFGLDSIISMLHQNLGGAFASLHFSRILGLGFVALGTVAMLYAASDHRYQLRRIQRNDLTYRPRTSAALLVAYCLIVFGAIAFLGILIGRVEMP
ncbi:MULTISPECIES: DUF202 domain-containing protein [unclassified Leptolyngbya]|uniref:YidH family protein n=1 Tax=unclassified Leptolyngbya TaxID=2650499 RepID=UPI0016898250|nr:MULTISPECIES: DUF202 domain-containing protein [unclassified Leptolyngbya]MBD1910389.1 DUF202 domain-containing protein [Leptolyngbya sp. FACHB-8]MBD2157785.1 DUF202 domain-containing protein [Leptolyngbya sp. FACHB-16]